MSKIVYKFNPYTFARISAMKSLLLQKTDYARVMKMDVSEITKFLQEGVYSKEINKLAMKYSGITLLENTLNKHLIAVFSKLKVISDPSIEFLMNQYLKRYDFWNIKTLLRAKLANVSEEDIEDLLMPVGALKLPALKSLYSKNVTEILESVVNVKEFTDAIQKYENKDLSEIENLLDYHYYLDSVNFANNIPKQGKLFKEFFKFEFDIYNIKLLLKKVFFNLDGKYVRRFILYDAGTISKSILNNILTKDDLSSLIREISKTQYRSIITDLESEDALLQYEIMLERFLLEKSILLYHQHPLTVDLVLGYMFAKEIEVRNLRTIIKSKALEYTENYVNKLIVISR